MLDATGVATSFKTVTPGDLVYCPCYEIVDGLPLGNPAVCVKQYGGDMSPQVVHCFKCAV